MRLPFFKKRKVFQTFLFVIYKKLVNLQELFLQKATRFFLKSKASSKNFVLVQKLCFCKETEKTSSAFCKGKERQNF
jgi:hypothetical protein